jgi:hypothetical protein
LITAYGNLHKFDALGTLRSHKAKRWQNLYVLTIAIESLL